MGGCHKSDPQLASCGPPLSPPKLKVKKRIDFARKPVLQFTVTCCNLLFCCTLPCDLAKEWYENFFQTQNCAPGHRRTTPAGPIRNHWNYLSFLRRVLTSDTTRRCDSIVLLLCALSSTPCAHGGHANIYSSLSKL